MEYVMKGKNVVGVAAKLTLNNMELSDDSGVFFHLICNFFSRHV
jgi:hypothetical protein